MLEEPTAAAMAYGLHQKPNVHHILVYDFGGGTLDVSLLYIHNGFITVSGVDGDEHLGGKQSVERSGVRVQGSPISFHLPSKLPPLERSGVQGPGLRVLWVSWGLGLWAPWMSRPATSTSA